MIEKILQHASTEWATLKSAPVGIALLVLMAFLISYALVRWSYALKLEAAKNRLAGIDERLAAKDRQLAEYRERLQLTSSDQMSYSRHTNADLKTSALIWGRGLREYLQTGEEDRVAVFVQFKAEAIVLRDELLSRLPSYARDDRWFSFYENADNAAGMAVVAEDLERLAESLPT